MQLDKEFVKNALSNAQMINGDFAPNSTFSVDTRTLQPGDVFVALQGQQCDGHQFIGDALAKKASGLVVAQEKRAEIDNSASMNNNWVPIKNRITIELEHTIKIFNEELVWYSSAMAKIKSNIIQRMFMGLREYFVSIPILQKFHIFYKMVCN